MNFHGFSDGERLGLNHFWAHQYKRKMEGVQEDDKDEQEMIKKQENLF